MSISMSLQEEMVRQIPTTTGWICLSCRNYQGSITCSFGIIICWEGANMSGCHYYTEERRKRKNEP